MSAATEPQTSPAPQGSGRGALSFGRWLAVSTGAWFLVATALVLAAYSDSARHGGKRTLAMLAAQLLPYFVPLVLHSAACGWYLTRRHLSGGVWELRLGLVALALFIPINGLFNAAISAWRAAWPSLPSMAGWWQQLQKLGLYIVTIDSMMAGGAFVALLAWTTWRQRQAQEQRWHEAHADNLRLRLQLLQGQLEPHFLFNVLNSVSALVRSGERAVALTALEQISTLLRMALRASRTPLVSVADELEFARTYIDVQRLRFGDALTVDWHLECDKLDELACPPLLLQPLIENAVVHGLESNQGRGHIDVQVFGRLLEGAAARQLVVRISNSLGPDKPGPGHGLGVHSTRERLRLLYGDRATLHIEADATRHTVELTLPAEPLA